MLFDMFQTRSWGHGIMCQHRKLYLLTMKKLSSQSQRSARLRKRLHPADKASGEESVRGGGWRADGEGGYRAIGNLSPAKSGIICTCNRLGGMGTCVCIEPVTALNTQMTILYGVLAVNSTLRKSFFSFRRPHHSKAASSSGLGMQGEGFDRPHNEVPSADLQSSKWFLIVLPFSARVRPS